MLLVTTTKSVLLVNSSGEIKPIHRGLGLYFGLTKGPDGYFYVASRNSDPSGDNKFIPPDKEDGEILIFNESLDFVKAIKPIDFKLQDLHGIGFWKNNLICTSSYGDAIAIYDGSNWNRWIPLERKENVKYRDCYHFNSVYGDDKLYILAHNWNDGSFVLEFDSLYSQPTNIIRNMGFQSHTLWKEDDKIYALSSRYGSVVSNCGDSITIGGWIRGMASTESNYYIGISPVSDKKNRGFGDSKIMVYNKSWDLQDKIILEDEGQILEIINY